MPSIVREIVTFANNHYAGHGPTTIRELAAWIRGELPRRPSSAELGGSPV